MAFDELHRFVISNLKRPRSEIAPGLERVELLPKCQAGLLEDFFRVRAVRNQREDKEKDPLLIASEKTNELFILFLIHRRELPYKDTDSMNPEVYGEIRIS